MTIAINVEASISCPMNQVPIEIPDPPSTFIDNDLEEFATQIVYQELGCEGISPVCSIVVLDRTSTVRCFFNLSQDGNKKIIDRELRYLEVGTCFRDLPIFLALVEDGCDTLKTKEAFQKDSLMFLAEKYWKKSMSKALCILRTGVLFGDDCDEDEYSGLYNELQDKVWKPDIFTPKHMTAMQISLYMQGIVNDGRMILPRLYKNDTASVIYQQMVSQSSIDALKDAMYNAKEESYSYEKDCAIDEPTHICLFTCFSEDKIITVLMMVDSHEEEIIKAPQRIGKSIMKYLRSEFSPKFLGYNSQTIFRAEK